MEISKEVKTKDILAELNKLSNEEIDDFLQKSRRPFNVPEKSIVYDVVKRLYGKYTISRMIIVRAYIPDVLMSRMKPVE